VDGDGVKLIHEVAWREAGPDAGDGEEESAEEGQPDKGDDD
jgi:hypothetical protein